MEQFRAMVTYIHQNPVKAGFVSAAAHWEFSSAGVMIEGRPGPMDIDTLGGGRLEPPAVGAGAPTYRVA